MFDGALHHIGVACRDLDAETRSLEALGYKPEGEADFLDLVQGIRGRFLVGAGTRLELVQPIAPGGVLDPWLARNAKMYHLAYEVPSLEVSLASLEAQRGRRLLDPVPAVAFDGRRIVFVMLPSLLLVELIEV